MSINLQIDFSQCIRDTISFSPALTLNGLRLSFYFLPPTFISDPENTVFCMFSFCLLFCLFTFLKSIYNCWFCAERKTPNFPSPTCFAAETSISRDRIRGWGRRAAPWGGVGGAGTQSRVERGNRQLLQGASSSSSFLLGFSVDEGGRLRPDSPSFHPRKEVGRDRLPVWLGEGLLIGCGHNWKQKGRVYDLENPIPPPKRT